MRKKHTNLSMKNNKFKDKLRCKTLKFKHYHSNFQLSPKRRKNMHKLKKIYGLMLSRAQGALKALGSLPSPKVQDANKALAK